jgi:hypothetical protein
MIAESTRPVPISVKTAILFWMPYACEEKPVDRTRRGSNTGLPMPVANERADIKARTDFFRGHQPPS